MNIIKSAIASVLLFPLLALASQVAGGQIGQGHADASRTAGASSVAPAVKTVAASASAVGTASATKAKSK